MSCIIVILYLSYAVTRVIQNNVLLPGSRAYQILFVLMHLKNPLSPTMITSSEDLPSATSKNVELCEPSEEEKVMIWRLNGSSWRGPLSMEAYIEREKHLGNQALTRDGGITYWLLTDSSQPPNKRPMLASCESLRKRALVKRHDGEVEEVVTHGIGSVFCDPKHRGRGYARRMIEELGRKLDNWKQKEGSRTLFTVLYSDIGKVVNVPHTSVDDEVLNLLRNFMLKAVGCHSRQAIWLYQS